MVGGAIAELLVLVVVTWHAATGSHPLPAAALPSTWRTLVELKSHECGVSFADAARAGEWLDQHADGAGVMGDAYVNELLPAVSSRVRMIVFRSAKQMTDLGLTNEEARAATASWNATVGAGATAGQRLAALDAAAARFLVVCGDPAWAAELARAFPARVELGLRSSTLAVYEIRPSPGPIALHRPNRKR